MSWILFIFHNAPAQVKCNSQSWIKDVLHENPSDLMDSNFVSQYNFSKIWLDDRTCYLGYIGNEFQKLDLAFISITKKSSNEYFIKGQSLVKSNKCDFHCIIRISSVRRSSNISKGYDNILENEVAMNGFIIAEFVFEEDPKQYGSGIFRGRLITRWYLSTGGEVKYDGTSDVSDGYANNQFLGTWASYKTKSSKTCAWGHYRIPCSGDLDIGAAEFSVNPKYKRNGWEYNDCRFKNVAFK